MAHFHMTRYIGDEDALVSDDIYAILSSAADVLRDLGDFEHESVVTTATQVAGSSRDDAGDVVNPGDMAAALRSYDRVLQYRSLQAGANEIWGQSYSHPEGRAPEYRDNLVYMGEAWVDGHRVIMGGPEAEWVVNTDSVLYQAALRTVERISNDSPIRIWECTSETGTVPEDDQGHGGETYCKDEFPDSYE